MALNGAAGIEGSTDPGAWLAHLFGFRLAGMRAHVSTHAEADLADLVARNPRGQVLSKAELSASAIRRIVDDRRG